MKRSPQKFDRRLIGTWKSDRRRTFLHYKPPEDFTSEKLDKFKSVFGKLTIRWGRGKYYTLLNGFRDVQSYEIVASDHDSVVVRIRHEIYGHDCLRQICFDGDHYWIALDGGDLCEWFKRVKSKPH